MRHVFNPITPEQMAWQLWENGVTYGEVSTYALARDCSLDEAVIAIWHKLLAPRNYA
jgi:hypothetical protein